MAGQDLDGQDRTGGLDWSGGLGHAKREESPFVLWDYSYPRLDGLYGPVP
jgi:hypothetical protein